MAYIRVTPDMVANAIADVDWEAQDALTDADIARQIAGNPDAAPDFTTPRHRLLRHMKSDRLTARQKVRLLRRALGLSQSEFASTFRIPLRTLQGWEQGTREPDEASRNFITLIASEPERVRRILAA